MLRPALRRYKALLFERTNSLCADLEFNLFAIYFDGFTLKVRFPDFFSVALAKANIAAVLLAFTGEFAFLHYFTSPNQGLIVQVEGVKVKTITITTCAGLVLRSD